MPRKPRILIVTECFYPEEFKINDVALSWAEEGFDVSVLTLAPTYPAGEIFPGYTNNFINKTEFKGVKIIRLRAVTGYKNNKFKKIKKYLNYMILASIYSIVFGRKYDYIFGYNLGALTDMLPVLIIKKIYNKPTLLWVHDIWPDSIFAYGFKKNKLTTTLLNNFVKLIYYNMGSLAISSKGFESRLKEFTHPNTKFLYAPNWADDVGSATESLELSRDKKVHFTFAGNLGKVQNLENIVQAFCHLDSKTAGNAQLNLIGDGSNLLILKKLSKSNPNIVFHGRQARQEMGKFYKASDFLILSLIDDPVFALTVPAKLQTYISVRKPILAIINGETADLVIQNKLGLTAEPGDINSIRELFVNCINMSDNEKLKFSQENDYLLKNCFNEDVIITNLKYQLLESDF